ncbi:YhcN/YlaJ family sporulation lipoprotein [Bacillus testis]|uniref:YhcN/YlaJ family sporulation lipoprotein n=1 Tax=Bacillus testis TaxID=1622072 RepID=UPI00067F2C08|nr:YhcN/YlaJ family sporulation lipoprotein [Bacillus testis]
MPKFRLAFLALLLVAGGCQMQKDNTQEQHNNASSPSAKDNARNDHDAAWNKEEIQKAADALKQSAGKVPQVQHVEAVVLGPYSFIAVDVDANLDRAKVAEVKQHVADAVKNEKYGSNALIVADPDMIASLKKVGNDIAAGEPVEGILQELSDIANRIVPETSAETNTEQTGSHK